MQKKFYAYISAFFIVWGVNSQAQFLDDLTFYHRGGEILWDADLPEIQAQGLSATNMGSSKTRKELQDILKVGARNLKWIEVLNSGRSIQNKLSFSSKQGVKGYSITAPKIYSNAIVRADFDNLKKVIPSALSQVLLGSAPLPTALPTDEATFLLWGRRVDVVYQTAVRLVMLEPYMGQLAAKKDEDLRGFYYLSTDPQRQSKLTNWNQLKDGEKNKILNYFSQMCRNNGIKFCDTKIKDSIKNGSLEGLYRALAPASQRLWNSYFELNTRRSDIQWIHQENKMKMPFMMPKDGAVYNFLKDNIEDEWKWNSWKLELQFLTNSFAPIPFVTFTPNATPHVDKLGGNEITMDKNAPLSEYEVQWTIRHEFGHVLGFRDCYLEFYDSTEKAIVSYQFDVTNLMCSRQGHLKEIHYQELKRLYGSQQ